MNDQIRVAVFASGRGSNFQTIHQVLSSMEHPPAEVILCVSNNPNPGAFEFARGVGIKTVRLSPKMFDDETDYDHALLSALRDHRVDMIVLAGYMRQLPSAVVKAYKGRILNIHPALLPKFGGKGMYGLHVHEAVLAAGESVTGPTVHIVDEEYDSGPIVAQEEVAVNAGDTPEILAARVLAAEHRLYPRVVAELAEKLARERNDPGAFQEPSDS